MQRQDDDAAEPDRDDKGESRFNPGSSEGRGRSRDLRRRCHAGDGVGHCADLRTDVHDGVARGCGGLQVTGRRHKGHNKHRGESGACDEIEARIDERRTVCYDERDEVIGVEFLFVSKGIDLSEMPEADRIQAALRTFPRAAA